MNQTNDYREYCPQCLFAKKTCYCAHIKRFDPKIKFVILIHQLEIDRKIATGRLSHLILENSLLIRGHDYSQNEKVNDLIADKQNYCAVLFPGDESVDVSALSLNEKQKQFPLDKQLVILVIDGTWATSRQTMRLSSNLASLPRFTFTLSKLSNFRIRKQPRPEFCSTVEAIYECICLLGESRGFDLNSGDHENLLHVFNVVVEQQLSFIGNSNI
jgi:DTW domain-containing protein YfiP